MRKTKLLTTIIVLMCSLSGVAYTQQAEKTPIMENDTIFLPMPQLTGKYSLEEVLQKRRSIRSFKSDTLSLQIASQMLWSAYGVTQQREKPATMRGGFKTAPSAGARYPLEIYLIAGSVSNLEQGVYRYITEKHALVKIFQGDIRKAACAAARDQQMVAEAPFTIVYTADFERTTTRYGDRGKNYVYVDLGHSAQNVYLQAEALDLSSCAIGAFTDSEIKKILNIPENETVIYMMPVGARR